MVWIMPSIFLGTGLRNIISIAVNTIREPSSAGIGKRFITARFADMIATTYIKLPNPCELTSAIVLTTVIVPPALSKPI